MRPTFDKRDAEILAASIKARDSFDGPRIGDFIRMKNGELRRFTYRWPEGIQTTWKGESGSFYLDKEGYVSYSGSLESQIPFSRIRDTGQFREGAFWFFHHGFQQAFHGVDCRAPCRVYEEIAP